MNRVVFFARYPNAASGSVAMRSGARSATSHGSCAATGRDGTQAGAVEGLSPSALALVSAAEETEPSTIRAARGGGSAVGARASAKACGGNAQQATHIAKMTRENVREAALMVRGLSSRVGGAVNGNPA